MSLSVWCKLGLILQLLKAASILETIINVIGVVIPHTLTGQSQICSNDYNGPYAWHESFLSFAVNDGLSLYVQAKLNDKLKLSPRRGRPLLDCAVHLVPNYDLDQRLQFVDADMVKTISSIGSDPNEQFRGQSA